MVYNIFVQSVCPRSGHVRDQTPPLPPTPPPFPPAPNVLSKIGFLVRFLITNSQLKNIFQTRWETVVATGKYCQ